ncbi:MAG: iron ABC transporter substrate-binding protein [Acidimicrobiia bacterium]|nr:iron ABC transporter substrate-binding protein [Acidimicrobiia bacterium]
MRYVIGLLIASLAMAACGGAGDPLTVYSGRSEELIGPLLEDFTEDTGIPVEVRYGGSADLALLIDQEGERSPADVFISQSPGAIGFLAEREHLAPIAAETLELVEPSFRNADGRWIGLSGRVRVLVYNTDLVDAAELPASVFELTDPAYEGRVALAPANGSFQDFVTAMRQVQGDDATLGWLEGMAANNSPEYANNSSIVQAVARGEAPMGLVNHYYNFRALAEDPGLPSQNHYFAGEDLGGLVIVTAAGILHASTSQDDANTLLEYLLGESAQQFLSEETFEYPLAMGATPWEGLPPLNDIGGATLDFDSLGGGLERTKELIDASGLEGP